MSRHRNVRNLTEDDYYDDYDDAYDDDDYQDQDDDYYYQQQQKKQQQQQQQAPAIAIAIKTNKKKKELQQRQNLPSQENVRLLMGMGFTKDQGEAALVSANGNVGLAVNMLLPAGDSKNLAPSPPVKPGIAKPPPGFGKPIVAMMTATDHDRDQDASSRTIPPVHAGRPMDDTSTNTKTTNTKPTLSKKDYGPPPTIPPIILHELSTQPSRRLSMVVLGHVDAGKSTLMGQVLVQLGHVQPRTITKYQKQAADMGKASFALAWVMDEDASERERGVTMDVATKSLTTPKHDVTVLDAPGHADFVPSMIAGAAAADVGLLVIAATVGEFEAGFDGGGQTREHIILARGLGVSQLIVAVNKLDLCDWSQARLEDIQRTLKPFLVKTGFMPKRIQFVPMSGLDGTNVLHRAGPDVALSKWYTGPTLLEAMDAFQPAQRQFDRPLRIIVSDVYSEGRGVTVKCRIAQGVVQVGDKLVVLPIGDEATVSKLEHGLMTGASIHRFKYAVAGDATEMVLSGIDIARISPGTILSHPQWELRPPIQKKIRCKVLVMDDLTVPIIRGASVLLHMHSIDVPAVLTKLISTATRAGLRDNPRVLTSGASATVEITLKTKICVEAYNDCRALGRFVLRRGGDTIAVGIVEQVLLI
jgi:elongation factor 1 alpha-like protein